jgi:hypothetical protein
MAAVPSPTGPDPAAVAEKEKNKPVSAMSFGGKQGCVDEACIGKT